MYCPKCGNKVGDYVRICPNCGELLEPGEHTGEQQNTQNTGNNNSGYGNYDYYGNQNYGYNVNQNIPVPQIPDYKVQSILLIVFSSILCCFTCISIVALPFAIVALVSSNKVHTHISVGNFDLAMEESKKAKMWCWVSFGILIGALILGIIAYIYLFTSGFYYDFLEQMSNYQYDYGF